MQIKQELAEKVKELPDIYEKISKKTKFLDKAVEFYSAFVNYTLGRQHDGGCVPMVKYVIGMLNIEASISIEILYIVLKIVN